MRGFLANVYLRPSCYACRCKNGASHSDLTIGDFWGIDTVAPDFDDDKGVGLVLVNTRKGDDRFRRLDLETLPSTLQAVHRHNVVYGQSARRHPRRGRFFSLTAKGRTVEQAVAACLHVPLYRRAIANGKRWVKRVINVFSQRYKR